MLTTVTTGLGNVDCDKDSDGDCREDDEREDIHYSFLLIGKNRNGGGFVAVGGGLGVTVGSQV